MSIIDSLKRLERAGQGHSKATQKLHAAAADLAYQIEQIVPEGIEMPRGYTVRYVQTGVGGEYFLTRAVFEDGEWKEQYIDGFGGYLHGDFSCWIPAQTRETSLAFASDVATGWLDELAVWLESRSAEAEKAEAVLRAAKAAM